MPILRKEIQDVMKRNIKIWTALMKFFDKYWGCHQMAERSFFIKGYQLPVCSRCTGIITGESAFIISALFSLKFNKLLYILLMIPLIIDGTLQFFTKYVSNNVKRFFSGIFFGFGYFGIIFSILSFIKCKCKKTSKFTP